MVLKPCEVGTGDQPKCKCGNLGFYQPEYKTQPGKCICNTNAVYNETTKQCVCLPGFLPSGGTLPGQYCYEPSPPPPERPRSSGATEQDLQLLKVIGITLGSMFGLLLVGYITLKIADAFPNQPPIVQAVVAPVAPAAIVPGIVMQNNPMLGANV